MPSSTKTRKVKRSAAVAPKANFTRSQRRSLSAARGELRATLLAKYMRSAAANAFRRGHLKADIKSMAAAKRRATLAAKREAEAMIDPATLRRSTRKAEATAKAAAELAAAEAAKKTAAAKKAAKADFMKKMNSLAADFGRMAPIGSRYSPVGERHPLRKSLGKSLKANNLSYWKNNSK